MEKKQISGSNPWSWWWWSCTAVFCYRLRSIWQVTWKHRESVTGQWHLMADVHITQPDWFAILERSNMFIFAKDHIPFPEIIINWFPFYPLHIDYIVPLTVKNWRSPTLYRRKQMTGLSVHIPVRLYVHNDKLIM